jgi:hypothetical protein
VHQQCRVSEIQPKQASSWNITLIGPSPAAYGRFV